MSRSRGREIDPDRGDWHVIWQFIIKLRGTMSIQNLTFRSWSLAIVLLSAGPVDATNLMHEVEMARRQIIHSRHAPAAWANLGYAFLQVARETAQPAWCDSAQSALNHAVAVDPANPVVNQYLAATDMAFHRFRDAIDHAQIALASDHSNADLHGLIGDAQLELGSIEAARASYQRMDSSCAPTVSSLARWANYYDMIGDNDKSLQSLEAAQNISEDSENLRPENVAWLQVMLGSWHYDRKSYDSAATFYSRALQIMPDYPLALEHLAEVSHAKGDDSVAIHLYTCAYEFTASPAYAAMLGNIFMASGDTSRGIARLKDAANGYRALIKSGNHGWLRPLAQLILVNEWDAMEALHLAKQDLLIRQDFEAYVVLAEAQMETGDTIAAYESIQKSLPLSLNHRDAIDTLCRIYEAAGRHEQAAQYRAVSPP